MPRTDLARVLRRLADEHRAAEDTESPENSQGHSRRTFLGASATAAGAALAFGAGARPAQAADRTRPAGPLPRVAIVGAGISGLAAALELHDHGVGATVYEADVRVGGRMYSNMAGAYWDGGQVSEWGGELVDSDHQVIQSLAKRFGLPLDDLRAAEPNSSTDTYWFGGRYYSYAQAGADFQKVHQAIQADMQSFDYPVTWDSSPSAAGIALADLSVYDWIETRVPGGHSSRFGQLLDVAYTIEYGADTSRQTALGLLGLLGYQPKPGNFALFGSSDERYHIRGGNQQLPLAIQAALPAGTVQFGQRLTKVAVNADGTQTLTFSTCDGPVTVVADHTILAVPLGVMKRLDFSQAGFDARKTGADERLRPAVPGRDRAGVPGDHATVDREGDAVGLGAEPEQLRVLLVLADRVLPALRGVRGRPAGQRPLRRGALLDGLPGVHGGWRQRGTAGGGRGAVGSGDQVLAPRPAGQCARQGRRVTGRHSSR